MSCSCMKVQYWGCKLYLVCLRMCENKYYDVIHCCLLVCKKIILWCHPSWLFRCKLGIKFRTNVFWKRSWVSQISTSWPKKLIVDDPTRSNYMCTYNNHLTALEISWKMSGRADQIQFALKLIKVLYIGIICYSHWSLMYCISRKRNSSRKQQHKTVPNAPLYTLYIRIASIFHLRSDVINIK
jgi:hypothetical protein